MKKIVWMLMILLTLALTASLGAAAESVQVSLGDDAIIPYFDGLGTSIIVRSPEDIRGITGAAQASFEVDASEFGGAKQRITVENISLTDDFLAVFYRMEQDTPFDFYDGRTPYMINRQSTFFYFTLNGEILDTHNHASEVRLLSDSSALCANVYTLPNPLSETDTLLLYSGYSDMSTNPEGDIRLTFDHAQKADYSRTFAPAQTFTMHMKPFDTAYDFEVRVDRIAISPFGNRLQYSILDYGEGTGSTFLAFALMDEKGNVLPVVQNRYPSSSIASKERPVWVTNSVPFLGGSDAEKLYILPLSNAGASNISEETTAFVALDAMPATLQLETGEEVHVESAFLNDQGFEIRWSSPGHRSFYVMPATADGQSLEDMNYVSYDYVDYAAEVQINGGAWSTEHKGQTVSRVSDGEIAGIGGFLFRYYPLQQPLRDQAVELNIAQ